MTAVCDVAGCDRPTDGYACSHHANRAAHQLADIGDMAGAARDVARRQTGNGWDDAGGGSPDSLPFDTMATAKLDAVQVCLTGWCSHIARERGILPPWTSYHGDPVAAAAQFVTGHVEWLRHRPPDDVGDWGAANFLADVEACHRLIRSIATGPADRRYLGPCGARVDDYSDETGVLVTRVCDGDVYGRPGAEYGQCRNEKCRARHPQAERRAWLDDLVRGNNYRAVHIAEAFKIPVNTIRTWHARGLLVPHGHDEKGRPLFNAGEVEDLALDRAKQRAVNQQRHARRG